MKDSGLEVRTYSYYDKKTVGLDFEGLKKDMRVSLISVLMKVNKRGIGINRMCFSILFFRPLLNNPSSYYMPVLTTQQVLILLKLNGVKSLTS